MATVFGITLGLVAVIGPFIGIPLIYERFNPNATVGDVGPVILLAYLFELLIVLVLGLR